MTSIFSIGYFLQTLLSGREGLNIKYELYKQVALAIDLPNKGFRSGDVATIVEHHPVEGGEDGYTLELFNALGETINVITIPESAIQPLPSDKILHVRPLVLV